MKRITLGKDAAYGVDYIDLWLKDQIFPQCFHNYRKIMLKTRLYLLTVHILTVFNETT